MLCYAMLCYAVLCYAVLCHALCGQAEVAKVHTPVQMPSGSLRRGSTVGHVCQVAGQGLTQKGVLL